MKRREVGAENRDEGAQGWQETDAENKTDAAQRNRLSSL